MSAIFRARESRKQHKSRHFDQVSEPFALRGISYTPRKKHLVDDCCPLSFGMIPAQCEQGQPPEGQLSLSSLLVPALLGWAGTRGR
jgi:hypothetical protein